jgi:transcriptional regulator with XRE-family HTH domain
VSAFSDILVLLRKQDGLTQVEVAKRLGISRSALSMYETGKREPDFETMEMFADFYNVNMDTLYGRGSPAQKESKPAAESDGLDPEMEAILERAKNDPHLRMLFSLYKDATPEDVETAIKIIQAIRGE